jgi:hypothetical protein
LATTAISEASRWRSPTGSDISTTRPQARGWPEPTETQDS